MRLGKDLEGKPIISVADGRILARAKDVFVDPQLSKLVGLYTGTEGVIRRRDQVIPSEDVVLYGIDVILVKNSDVIVNDKDLPEVKEWQRLKDLQGREVVTPGGTKLGKVGDVILEETGSIVGLNLARVHVKGPLAESGSVPREAVVNPNQEDGSIGVDLAYLEQLHGGIEAQEVVDEETGQAKEAAAELDDEEGTPEAETEEIPVVVVDSEDNDADEEPAAESAEEKDDSSADNNNENA